MFWMLHLTGLVLWFGGLVALSLAPVRQGGEDPADRVRRSLNLGMAWPGFVLVLLGGLGLIHSVGMEVFSGGWFHVKLTLALVVLVLHILMSTGKLKGSWLAPVLVALVLAGFYLVYFRPF